MRHLIYILLLILPPLFSSAQSGFKSDQMKYERVREAYQSKENKVKTMLHGAGIEDYNINIYLRVFKSEKCVEVWVKKTGAKTYTHLTDYKICQSSGELGPKRQQGDGQVPEGAYYVNRFNPVSSFHLSLGINYPNLSDTKRGVQGNLGGDIFIHGKCVTIGCIPITDDNIKELYILAIEAREHGQTKIPVHIFPFRMEEDIFSEKKKEDAYSSLIPFWEEISPVYVKFQSTKTIPSVTVSSSGKYIVN